VADGTMRPFRVRLDQARRTAGVANDAVLKDYALSYLLAGIQSVPELDQTLAFKGGTALRKCFFEGYRFSEDLDFTLLEPIEDLEPLVRRATEGAVQRMSEYGPFSAEVRPAAHRAEHPFGQQDFRITLKYPTGASLPLKVEITRDEPIVVGTERRNILHAFPEEDLQVSVNCYRIEEIVIEKLRAFLQARENLGRRDWLNRSRDLYDLWAVRQRPDADIDWGALRSVLAQKCEARGVAFEGPDDFLDQRVLQKYREQWRPRLEGFVPQGALPDFDAALKAMREALAEIFGSN